MRIQCPLFSWFEPLNASISTIPEPSYFSPPFDASFHFSQSFKILAYVTITNIVVYFLSVSKMLKYEFLLC